MSIAELNLHQSKISNGRPLYPESRSDEQVSVFTVISILIASLVTFNPYYGSANLSSGLAEGMILYIIGATLTLLSFSLFIRCWRYGSTNSYAEISNDLGGIIFKIISDVLMIATYLYLTSLIFADTHLLLKTIVSHFYVHEYSIVFDKWILQYVVALLPAIPAIFCKSLAGMKYCAHIANLTLIISIVTMIVIMTKLRPEYDYIRPEKIPLFNNDIQYLVVTFAKYCGKNFIHPIAAFIVPHIKNPSQGKIYATVAVSSFIGSIIILCGMLISFFSFYDGLILHLYPIFMLYDSEIVLELVCQFATLIHYICSYSLYIFITSRIIPELFSSNGQMSFISVIISNLIAATFTVSFESNDSFHDAMNYIGLIAYFCLCFFLPSIMFLIKYRFVHIFWSIIALVVLVITAVPLIYNLYHLSDITIII